MSDHESIPSATESSVDAVQGANPFVGLTPSMVLSATARWATALGQRPSVALGAVGGWAMDEISIVAGSSTIEPDPKDRRFTDEVWRTAVWRRVAQTYLATRESMYATVDRLDLDQKSADRARFALLQLTEAASPTNNLFTNPVALRRAVETRGRSLIDGLRHFAHDVRHNGGMPSQVDTRPFRVGETVAATEGEVVYRAPMFELIQYRPTTTRVYARPTVIIPPQINRYYFLDLVPGRSFVEHALSKGIQLFMISWRNPGRRHHDWGLDDYARAAVQAMEVAAQVSGSESVNVAGLCAGGMTTSATLSHLAKENAALVNAATLAVTMIDAHVHSTLNMFATERSLKAALDSSRRKGVLDGRSMARMFAFVRPNDLVWNYVVSNYLLGQNPPAFDVLAWNKDATNLPHALHAAFLNLWIENSLMDPGTAQVLGTPIDLASIKNDMYIVSAVNDHLVPWQSAYAATQILGGKSRFVLSNGGHIQALVNPPGNPRSSFRINQEPSPPEPEKWVQGSREHSGTWWDDWTDWTSNRSGPERSRPRRLGSTQHPGIEPAPGRYVLG